MPGPWPAFHCRGDPVRGRSHRPSSPAQAALPAKTLRFRGRLCAAAILVLWEAMECVAAWRCGRPTTYSAAIALSYDRHVSRTTGCMPVSERVPVTNFSASWTQVDQTSDPSFYASLLDATRAEGLAEARRDPDAAFAPLKLQAGLRVLDVGCGTGDYLRFLAPLV